MKIGVPSEIKNHEYRVGLIPSSVRECVTNGHDVVVQSNAGIGIGFKDSDYIESGATIVQDAKDVFAAAELIVKVKEPQPEECAMLQPQQTLFTYLHLAPDLRQAQLLLESKVTAIAYETVTDAQGRLPLLSPMSEVAGRMSIQAGAHCLEKAHGGLGILLGGIPGVRPADVLVIGGGVVGTNALRMAIGMEARVTIIDKSLPRLQELDSQFGASLNTIYATEQSIEYYAQRSDLIVGAVLVPGGESPKLLKRSQLASMRKGAVIVDVSIDQGGCFETSRPTTHSEPTFIVDDIVHYCVANIPGAVPRTSSVGLNNATLPFVLALANQGTVEACLNDKHLLNGLNVFNGNITNSAVAKALKLPYKSAQEIW